MGREGGREGFVEAAWWEVGRGEEREERLKGGKGKGRFSRRQRD